MEAIVTEEHAKEIKDLLWQGAITQKELAVRFSTHQSVISNIQNGRLFSLTEWPDGSFGAMNVSRKRVLIALRRQSAAYKSHGATDPEILEIAGEVSRRLAKTEEEEKHLAELTGD
mgnify:FL=1|jgi:hypothetical protein|tara:strand:+ start:432 stop:779 length:348 start_codon:yes stop_codon:yes gene_type:complete